MRDPQYVSRVAEWDADMAAWGLTPEQEIYHLDRLRDFHLCWVQRYEQRRARASAVLNAWVLAAAVLWVVWVCVR